MCKAEDGQTVQEDGIADGEEPGPVWVYDMIAKQIW